MPAAKLSLGLNKQSSSLRWANNMYLHLKMVLKLLFAGGELTYYLLLHLFPLSNLLKILKQVDI